MWINAPSYTDGFEDSKWRRGCGRRERNCVCGEDGGVRPLGGAINIDQWERGGRRSKAVGENDCLISSMNEIYA